MLSAWKRAYLSGELVEAGAGLLAVEAAVSVSSMVPLPASSGCTDQRHLLLAWPQRCHQARRAGRRTGAACRALHYPRRMFEQRAVASDEVRIAQGVPVGDGSARRACPPARHARTPPSSHRRSAPSLFWRPRRCCRRGRTRCWWRSRRRRSRSPPGESPLRRTAATVAERADGVDAVQHLVDAVAHGAGAGGTAHPSPAGRRPSARVRRSNAARTWASGIVERHAPAPVNGCSRRQCSAMSMRRHTQASPLAITWPSSAPPRARGPAVRRCARAGPPTSSARSRSCSTNARTSRPSGDDARPISLPTSTRAWACSIAIKK